MLRDYNRYAEQARNLIIWWALIAKAESAFYRSKSCVKIVFLRA